MQNKKTLLGIVALVAILVGSFVFFNSRSNTGDFLGKVQRVRQVRTSAPPSLPALPAPVALPGGGAPSALPSGTPQAVSPSTPPPAQVNAPSAALPSAQVNAPGASVRGPASSPVRRNTSPSGLPTLPPSFGGGNSQPYSIQQVNSFLAGVSNAPSNYTIASRNPISSQSSIDFANDIKGLIIDEGNIVGILVNQEDIANDLGGRFTGGLMDEPGAGSYSADDLFNMAVVYGWTGASGVDKEGRPVNVAGWQDSNGNAVGSFTSDSGGTPYSPHDGDTTTYGRFEEGHEFNGVSGNRDTYDSDSGQWLPYDDNDIDNDGVANSQDGDMDRDGILNHADPDDDDDGIPDGVDSDPDNPYQGGPENNDIDGDGTVNDYDSDMDGDGIPNSEDNDIDEDGYNNNVDSDDDGDGVADDEDNSPSGASDEDEDADAGDDDDDDADGSGDIWSGEGRCPAGNICHKKGGGGAAGGVMEQIENLINSYLNGGSTAEELEQMIEQQLGTQVNVQEWVMVDNISQQTGFSAPANAMPFNQFQIQIGR